MIRVGVGDEAVRKPRSRFPARWTGELVGSEIDLHFDSREGSCGTCVLTSALARGYADRAQEHGAWDRLRRAAAMIRGKS